MNKPISLETPVGDSDSQLADFIEDTTFGSPVNFVLDQDLAHNIARIPARSPRAKNKSCACDSASVAKPCTPWRKSAKVSTLSRERIRQIEVSAQETTASLPKSRAAYFPGKLILGERYFLLYGLVSLLLAALERSIMNSSSRFGTSIDAIPT